MRVIGEVPNIDVRWNLRPGFLGDLFTNRFWDETVPRDGAAALRDYGQGENGIRIQIDNDGFSAVFNSAPSDEDYMLGVPRGYQVEANGKLVAIS